MAKVINEKINSSLNVKNCSILDYKSDKFFDIIFLNNVIEHFENWEESLDILNKLLSPKGKDYYLIP